MESEFKLNQIGFIMLGVNETARSVAFYRDQLGLSVKMAFEGFTFLDAGAVTLALSEDLAQATHGPIAGATEVVFSVPDVRAAHAALRSKGVEFTHEPRQVSGPMWAVNFRDPDGHGLSVFGPERASQTS
ncbi:MAG TPA: VOC family protein [Terriglobia bacterium]|nr:VOC family protein [Terriglobia bacterium]